MMPVPPSLLPMTTVLSCGKGLARRFSQPPTPVSPEPLVREVELAEDVALARVRTGGDVRQRPAVRAAFFAVHEDARRRCRDRLPELKNAVGSGRSAEQKRLNDRR